MGCLFKTLRRFLGWDIPLCPGGLFIGWRAIANIPDPFCCLLLWSTTLVITSETMFLAAVFRCGAATVKPFLSKGKASLNNPRKMPPRPAPYCELRPLYPGKSPPA